MTAQDLKNSILQLAVQGKLVPQSPDDEPASELIKRIADERTRRIAAGTLVVDKKHTADPITADDILYDLPENWKWARFADIVTFNAGKTPQRQNTGYWSTGEYPWLSIADMQSDSITTTTKESISKTAFDDCFSGKISPAGTMIMSFKLTIGKVSVLGMDAVHNEAIISIYPTAPVEDSRILQKWLFKIIPLVAATGNSKNAIKGKTLNATSISNLMIPVPPLAEQERIVAKIEELLPFVSEYDEAEKRLSALNAGFPDKLRKSILQRAVQGKLTERSPSDEPASELLKRIQTEKAKLIAAGKIKMEKPLPPITEDDCPFEIPDEWEWVRLTDVGEVSRGRSKHRPRNDAILYRDGKYPLVQTGDVARSGGLITSCSSFYNDVGLAQSRMWPKGTLCLTIAANIADVGILDFDACFPDSVVGFNAFSPITSNKYFLYMLMAYKAILDRMATRSAQKNINLETIASLAYPLPPLVEQKRIVERVEKLLAMCDALE